MKGKRKRDQTQAPTFRFFIQKFIPGIRSIALWKKSKKEPENFPPDPGA